MQQTGGEGRKETFAGMVAEQAGILFLDMGMRFLRSLTEHLLGGIGIDPLRSQRLSSLASLLGSQKFGDELLDIHGHSFDKWRGGAMPPRIHAIKAI
jgi:hypothetical protein